MDDRINECMGRCMDSGINGRLNAHVARYMIRKLAC